MGIYNNLHLFILYALIFTNTFNAEVSTTPMSMVVTLKFLRIALERHWPIYTFNTDINIDCLLF